MPKIEPLPASRVIAWTDDLSQPATQGTLALALPSTFGSLIDGRPDEAIGTDATTGAGPTDSVVGLLSEPHAWAGTFIQAAMEVAVGLRSPGQMIRWTTPEVHAMLVRRGALNTRAKRTGTMGAKPRVRALLGCSPRPGVCEMSAVIAESERVRAVAFRMEGLHGRWRVTEMQIG